MPDKIARCIKHPRRKAVATWIICSDGTTRGVCRECDLYLNKIGIKWAFPKTWRPMFQAYKEKVRGQ